MPTYLEKLEDEENYVFVFDLNRKLISNELIVCKYYAEALEGNNYKVLGFLLGTNSDHKLVFNNNRFACSNELIDNNDIYFNMNKIDKDDYDNDNITVLSVNQNTRFYLGNLIDIRRPSTPRGRSPRGQSPRSRSSSRSSNRSPRRQTIPRGVSPRRQTTPITSPRSRSSSRSSRRSRSSSRSSRRSSSSNRTPRSRSSSSSSNRTPRSRRVNLGRRGMLSVEGTRV